MIPVKQNKLHTDTQRGNCMRACLASLFEVNIDDIKPFEDYFHEDRWFDIFLHEIDNLGYEYDGWCKLENLDGYQGIDGYLMIGGGSPIFPDVEVGHACLWKNGEIVHDPHPDNTGLTSIVEVYLIKRK